MQETIKHIKEELSAYYPESEISGFVRIIVEHITQHTYPAALINNTIVTKEQKQEIDNIINRLQKHEPIQYILGESEFFGMPFFVSPHVLIPRPETEELVELILNENSSAQLSVLDIGTGSGCIAIALAKYLNKPNVSAWDISADALNIAHRNAIRNESNVSFEQVDVLSENRPDTRFDIIVSNPPYILDSEKAEMDNNVLDHEPHVALFVPNDNALLFYRRIADIALDQLNPSGKLYFEINRAKGEETMEMLKSKGFDNVELFQDLSGNDRMIRCVLSKQ